MAAWRRSTSRRTSGTTARSRSRCSIPSSPLSLGSERFLREIQIAARLQHPHIVPLYDSGQAGDLLYYVMPFVEGEIAARSDSTARRSSPSRTRSASRACVASALDYAHRQKIVHRDIKPENVMLHEGEPMVTDFGIAKAVTAAVAGIAHADRHRRRHAGVHESGAGRRARPSSTRRSDIYSLGCHALRDDRRDRAVHRPHGAGDHREALHRAGAAARRPASRRAGVADVGGLQGAGQGPGRRAMPRRRSSRRR